MDRYVLKISAKAGGNFWRRILPTLIKKKKKDHY
jgi:hypothetical protein